MPSASKKVKFRCSMFQPVFSLFSGNTTNRKTKVKMQTYRVLHCEYDNVLGSSLRIEFEMKN